jgi:protein subunit release factor A
MQNALRSRHARNGPGGNDALAPEIERAEDALKMLLDPGATRATTRTSISKSAGTGDDERRSSRAICIACTRATPRRTASMVEILSESPRARRFREVISRIAGRGVFARFVRIGVHRVQRVPATEAQDASTRRPAPWPFFLNRMKWKRRT